MRRILLLLLGLILLVFSACSQSVEVGSIVFVIDDGPIPPQYFANEDMTVVPNYEDRTLTITYQKYFPNRTDKTPEEDVEAQGEIGGEFFDRFERLIEFADQYEPLDVEGGGGVGSGIFEMRILGEDGSLIDSVETQWANIRVESLKNFYLDVRSLLTAEVPV